MEQAAAMGRIAGALGRAAFHERSQPADGQPVTRQVADRIRQIRRLHGWSARELAEGCEAAGSASLTRSTIAKIESGVRKSVTADEIAVLALVLDVTPTDLIAPGEPAVGRIPSPGVRPLDLPGLPVVPGGADGSTQRQYAAAPNFWAALAPAQREAFRSVASWRAFPAGATLMQEGEPAHHVSVILDGRTKICIEENGRERILAERGPGELIGERGVLQASVRSASVIALESVRVLVMQTEDFAAFISTYPSVLEIIERTLYERFVETSAGSRLSSDSGSAHKDSMLPSSGRDFPAGRPGRRPQPLRGENCTVVVSDVVGFSASARNDEDRRVIRETLFRMTRAALRGMPDSWSWVDRGDGLLTVVPPSIPTAIVMDNLLMKLPAELARHNVASRESAQIKLRVAVNVGPVISDDVGVAGEAILATARLVEAPSFKKIIARSAADLGIIVSTFVYESVIKQSGDPVTVADYTPVQVGGKGFDIRAWVKQLTAGGERRAGHAEPGAI